MTSIRTIFRYIHLIVMKSIIFVSIVVCVFAKNEIYDGWRSYYIKPETQFHLLKIMNVTEKFGLDVLIHPSIGREGVVLVKPTIYDEFLEILEKHNVPFKLHSTDVKKSLDDDEKHVRRRRDIDNKPYNSYQQLDQIYEYLDDIARKYPEKLKLVEPNVSFEGRKIKYVKISNTNFENASKPIIYIDGGIHGREWISPTVIIWAIHKLVENVTEPELLDRFDWILFPVVNPDGYEYTFTTNRFWRKTRSTNDLIGYEDCRGVDGNRNFDFYWNSAGSSFSPCDETYAGSKPFSEVETRVVHDILHENLNRIALYLTIHSYGSMILYPWGHDGSASPYLHQLKTVASSMAEAIRAKQLPLFPKYMVGNSALVLFYGAAGASDDYAHLIGVPLSFTIEMPGLAAGLHGFHLEPQYIQQVCDETWEGFVAGAKMSGDYYFSEQNKRRN